MFGSYPGGEILFASIPKPITGPGGDNEITVVSPGRSMGGDGNTEYEGGDTMGGNTPGGDTFGGEAVGGETLG